MRITAGEWRSLDNMEKQNLLIQAMQKTKEKWSVSKMETNQ